MVDSQSTEDRLRAHAKSFEGLLALIPAKQYYLEDTSDQWRRKKQTKEEARAAKMAKLNPDNNRSALDILQENERKRKRTDGGEAPEAGVTLERPLEGLKPPKQTKKQKSDTGAREEQAQEVPVSRSTEAERKRQKKEEKKARKEAKQAKQQTKQDKKQQGSRIADEQTEGAEGDESGAEAVEHGEDDLTFLQVADLGETNVLGDSELGKDSSLKFKNEVPSNTENVSNPSSGGGSPFDFSAQPSGTSSISSIATAASLAQTQGKSDTTKTPQTTSSTLALDPVNTAPKRSMEEMQERLRQIIADKRAKRSADIEGRPARTRAELLEGRRKKQEQRKATKKALRQQAKEEETRQREEAIARGSPLMSPAVHSPSEKESANSFSFGKIAFENGHAMTADLSATLDLSKRKGPSDLKTALIKASAGDARVAALAPEKRAEAEEKKMWLDARKRAHGEKVRDDTSLLKKALKRKQKQKDKSANDWQKRLAGIKAAKESKQKKREDNLAKRKEDKGKTGGKGSKAKKPKKRPGFEGSFRAGGRK